MTGSPAAGQAHYNLGRLYRLMARNLDAVRAFERAAARNPLVGQDNLYETIGAIHVVEGELRQARSMRCRQRVDVSPNNAEAHRKLGEVYLQQNRSDEALAEFLVALLVDPRSRPDVRWHRATSAAEGASTARPRRHHGVAVESRPGTSGGSLLARIGAASTGTNRGGTEGDSRYSSGCKPRARTREEREWELRLIRQAASVSLDKGDYERGGGAVAQGDPVEPRRRHRVRQSRSSPEETRATCRSRRELSQSPGSEGGRRRASPAGRVVRSAGSTERQSTPSGHLHSRQEERLRALGGSR